MRKFWTNASSLSNFVWNLNFTLVQICIDIENKTYFFYRCLVQVAYAIGVAEPLSICVMDYGTSSKTQDELTAIVRKNFDLRPGKIVK